MKKRGRHDPCSICGHFHNFEDGEICNICGHQKTEPVGPAYTSSAFPSEILPEFLYVGSFDHASRMELLKAQGFTDILNTVPSCQNLYKQSFIYFNVTDSAVPFEKCIEFIESVRNKGTKVLVHCMSGNSRSPSVIVAYLMKSRGWRLEDSLKWVKEKRPSAEISEAMLNQLREFQAHLLGESSLPFLSVNSEPFARQPLPEWGSGVTQLQPQPPHSGESQDFQSALASEPAKPGFIFRTE